MGCVWRSAKYLPLLLCAGTPLVIFLTYGIAVGNGHVAAFWPYISDTGTKPPESCVFGLLLSCIAFVLCGVIYVRYRQVSEFVKLYPSTGISRRWNRLSVVLGLLSALGLHIVANFQELNEFLTHILGALLCFTCAILYFLLQTIFTARMHPERKRLLWIRIIFTLLNVLFLIGTFATVEAAMKEFDEKGNKKQGDQLKWTVDDPGFLYHAISTFSEWFMVFSFCGYICSFHWEFKDIEIEPPQIKFISLEETTRTEATDVAGEEDGKAKSPWI